MSVLSRNNVKVGGAGQQPMMFAHGFGCDQNMWRFVAPAFEADYRVVLFDHVDDVIEICQELGLSRVIFVGHSVSAMIGALASAKAPELFESLVMVGPSPRYIDDTGYAGGFTADQIDELLHSLADNHMGWSASMAPAIMGNPDRPELAEELTDSFCRTDPDIAKDFARVTFTSDNRGDLSRIKARTLVLQCANDIIAAEQVGEYVHAQVRDSKLVYLEASGHCPNLSAPDEVIAAIRDFA